MSFLAKFSKLPEVSRQSSFIQFNQVFSQQFKRFVLFAMEVNAWTDLDPSNTDSCELQAQIAQVIGIAEEKMNKVDTFRELVDHSELQRSIQCVVDNFLEFMNQVQQFRLIVQDHFDQNNQDDQELIADPIQDIEMADHSNNHVENGNNRADLNLLSYEVADLNLKTNLIGIKINQLAKSPQNFQLNEVIKHFNEWTELLETCDQLISKVILKWKDDYKKSLIFYPYKNYLKDVQEQFKQVVQAIVKMKTLMNSCVQAPICLPHFGQILDQALTKLLEKSMVIESQPCVYQKKKSFSLKCRFLFGENSTNFSGSIKVFLNKEFPAENETLFLGQREINSNPVKLNKLKIDELPWPINGYVAEQLYYFHLEYKINFNDGPTSINFEGHQDSQPISIITKQEAGGWGSIMWRYLIDGQTKKNSEEFGKVIQILNDMYMNKLGRGLTKQNFRFISTKLKFNDKGEVTKESLIRIPSTNKKESKARPLPFWQYFYNAFKLTEEEGLRGLWHDGLIIGFISKNETKDILMNCHPGTFLLRYSEREHTGGICVSYYDHAQRSLQSLEAFKQDNIKGANLADLLRSCRIKEEPVEDIFTHIYTGDGDLPKEKHEAFKGHYTKIKNVNKKAEYLNALIQIFIRTEKPKLHKSRN